MAFAACARHPDPPRASFVPLEDLEHVYGHLITAGNHPTPDQNGTGDRLGLFLDTNGTIWGLPLTISPGGAVLGCAPPALHDSKITDTYPTGATIIGATNESTGWRGGTGKLELLLRGPHGGIHWRAVNGARMAPGPVCWAQESPGPPQQLQYYRLVQVTGQN
jgi:hypothetical protein